MSNAKQAQTHIEALGYGPTDRVYFRAIGPNGAAKKIEGTIEQRFDELRTLNGKGFGVYLVVNGGGQSDADVTHGQAIFYEHDDIPKEAQVGLWQPLGLPEPTIQIDTGGKSIHSFWVFDQAIPISDWKILQKDLLDFADADRTIKNPSRIMRLPGFTHQKSGGESVIISNNGKRYSFDELRSVVAVPEPAPKIPAKTATQPRSDASSSDIGAILSDDILPRLSASQIFNWSGHGFKEQPDGKLKGNCPWHGSQSGTSFWVTPSQDGATHTGACPTCTGNKKLNAVAYRYALKTNKPGAGQPTGRDFFDVAKELAADAGVTLPEYDPQQPKGDRHGPNGSNEQTQETLQTPWKCRPVHDLRSPKDSIVAAIELGLIGSDLEAKKLEVAEQLRIFPRDFNTLWTVIEREIEQRDGRSDRSDAIDGLILKKSQRLDIGRIIPPQLATPLKRRAELLGSIPEALLAVFIPAVASQAKIGTRLHLNRGSDWSAKPIFWSGVVGSPATSKSPTLNVFYDPFREIQALDQERYEEELKHYLEACEEARDKEGPRVDIEVPTKPVRRLVDDFTTESLATIQKDQPTDGCLLGLDELAGLLGTLGQYKSGKGSDKQKLLSLRDGKGFSVTRASGSAVMTKSTSFSLSGGIQPAVLAAQMGDFSDSDGYWSRFNWVILPLLRKQFGDVADYGAAKQLREDIVYCYSAIKDLEPVEYDLSPEAERLFRSFCSEAQDNRLGHPNLSMQVAWGKSEGQLGELALILHLLWGIGLEGQKGTPSTFVSKATFERAIELMRFFIVQTELIQELGQEVSGGEDAIFAKILELGRSKGPLKAADVKNSLHDLKKDKTKNADYIRGLFNELAAMGKGVVIGEGRSLQFRPLADGEVVDTASKPPADSDVLAVARSHGWTENDIKEMRQALANKYAEEQAGEGVSGPSYAEHCETLRSIIPPELWSTIGL